MYRTAAALIVTGLIASVVLAADEPGAATTRPAAASTPASLPAGALRELDAIQKELQRSGLTREEATRAFKAGLDLEAKYPHAPDLYKIQGAMLQSGYWIARQMDDASILRQTREIASRVVNSEAPLKARLNADYFLTLIKVLPKSTSQPSSAEATAEIKALVDKYASTDAAGAAYVFGAGLAGGAELKDLQDAYADTLGKKYLQEQGARAALRKMGRRPDVGKAFEAELTKMDGKALTLPKDLAGKVVVIDFWASWCPPCRASAPALKKAYEKYKPKGVEFVGVSLDRPGEKELAEKFIKDKGLDWIQTHSGKFWNDPTVRKYGIDAIPALWVIGKDGKVVSDGVDHEDLEADLDKAVEEALATGDEKK